MKRMWWVGMNLRSTAEGGCRTGRLGAMVAMKGLLLLVILATGTAWGEDAKKLPTADEILVKMKAKWDGVKSFEMDGTTKNSNSRGPNGDTNWNIRRVGEKGSKDGVVRSLESEEGTWIAAGKVMTDKAKVVRDGTYFWHEGRYSWREGIHVTKLDVSEEEYSWADAAGEFGPMALEVGMRQFNMKVTGEDIINGQKMYVLEGGKKRGEFRGDTSNRKFWIGEDDLLVWRWVLNSDQQQYRECCTFNVSKVKVDEKIDPKAFEYKPPAGAVMEATAREVDLKGIADDWKAGVAVAIGRIPLGRPQSVFAVKEGTLNDVKGAEIEFTLYEDDVDFAYNIGRYRLRRDGSLFKYNDLSENDNDLWIPIFTPEKKTGDAAGQ